MGRLTQAESAERLRKLLDDLVRELVDRPDEVSVFTTISDGGNTVVLTVRTANGEVGKVIGKQGRNAQAVRILLEAVAAKYKQRVVLEIDDNRRRRDARQDMGRR
jgi:predicted RNA-binding protein YlqC (UPF0109 family)